MQRNPKQGSGLREDVLWLSHELRGPMNGILGMCELLEKQLAPESEASEMLGVIMRSAQRLVHLVSDVLDHEKLHAGKMQVDRNNFDLPCLLRDCLLLFGKKANASRVRVTLEAAAGLPQFVVGDEKKLAQILGNLLSNAVKYTEEGCICLEVKQEVQASEELVLRFEVRDTGHGIAVEEQAKVFTAFEQTQSAQSSSTRSSGLGLYLTKQLVELLDGEISFTSSPGLGSSFVFRLPFSRGFQPSTLRTRSPIAGRRLPTQLAKVPGRVLIIDDDPINLEVVRRQLLRLDSEVIGITDPQEAASVLSREVFDLVLLDYHFPDHSGAELLKAWRTEARLSRYTPVVALTAMAQKDVRQQILSEGFDDYLAKPAGLDEMAKLVGRWVPLSRLTHKLLKREVKPS